MEKWKLLLLSVSLLMVCCKEKVGVEIADDSQNYISNTQTYYHLSVGDSVEYNNAHVQTVENAAIINSQEFYGVFGVVLRDTVWDFYLRMDDSQRVYIYNFSPRAQKGFSLLYKLSASAAQTWTTDLFGDTVMFTMESRTDTVTASVGTFYDCEKIKIQYSSTEYEEQWFAKGLGLVKRNYVGESSALFPNLLVSKFAMK